MTDPEEQVRALAQQARNGSDAAATAWFERLYDLAQRGQVEVPWDRGAPHPLIAEWIASEQLDGAGRTAVVVGCGFGADAELVASYGFETTGFDVSETAIELARQRHPRTAVTYLPADLFDLPSAWLHAFELVVEVMTVQSLPRRLREASTAAVQSLVAAEGQLVVVASALGAEDELDAGPPWPLTRAEVDAFAADGLIAVDVQERFAPPDIRRWWGRFARS